MTSNNQIQIDKDLSNKKIIVTRNFDALPEEVWKAWTQSDLLDSWWAPKPWKAETKSINFAEGGHWLYAMVGPDGTRHWARVDFIKIVPLKSFEANDSFCDEEGVTNKDMPAMHWKNEFSADGQGTQVKVEITFPTTTDLEKIIEMGFESGFTAALTNLDEIFRKDA